MLDFLRRPCSIFLKLRWEGRKNYKYFLLFCIAKQFTKVVCYESRDTAQNDVTPTFLSLRLLSTSPPSSVVSLVNSVEYDIPGIIFPSNSQHTCTHTHMHVRALTHTHTTHTWCNRCHLSRPHYSLIRHEHSVDSFISFVVKSN